MEFEERYAANFKSRKGQPACPARMALGALLIKERYGLSDADVVAEIKMNPYLQYFLGLREYHYAVRCKHADTVTETDHGREVRVGERLRNR